MENDQRSTEPHPHLSSRIFGRTMIVEDVDEFLNTKVHYDPFAPSPIPFALRVRGSILGSMIPVLLGMGVWSSVIVYVSIHHYNLGVDSILITIMGLVTSLALAFRVNSAYERYTEGRKYWSQLSKVVRTTSRLIWWSIPEEMPTSATRSAPHTSEEVEMSLKQVVLYKATAVKILVGFVYALKHHLRGEFGTDWDDLRDLVEFLPTYGRLRSEIEKNYNIHPRHRSRTNSTLSSLQTTFLRGIKPLSRQPSNRLIKATIAHGNLPLELLSFLGSYMDLVDHQGRLSPVVRGTFMEKLEELQDILSGCERVLRTPLPLAYNISIAQITWVFILLLPFQLVEFLKWITIPATLASAYMLLGLSHLSFEIENPFGNDTNDLPLDHICNVISTDVDVICAHRMSNSGLDPNKWLYNEKNRPLFPVVKRGFEECLENMSIAEIREALRLKVEQVRGEESIQEGFVKRKDGANGLETRNGTEKIDTNGEATRAPKTSNGVHRSAISAATGVDTAV